MTSLPPILIHDKVARSVPVVSAPRAVYSRELVHLDTFAKSLPPPLLTHPTKETLDSSDGTLRSCIEDNDDCSVSSSDSESSYGSEKTFDFMSGNGKSNSKRHSVSSDVTAQVSFSNPDCDGRQISPMKMFSGPAAHGHLPILPYRVAYDNNGRRMSITEQSCSAYCPNTELHRQIEADLLHHRNLVALKTDDTKVANIARIQIAVDSKVASTMAARTFVDTSKIQVHQRRSFADGLPSERRGSLSKQTALLCLPPMNHGIASSTSDLVCGSSPEHPIDGGLGAAPLPQDPAQRSQLRRAGRVVAASRRLLMGGMQDEVVGSVECMASARTTHRQPRFAQATVGSLMAVKG